jgi:hypothetical protein
MRHLAASWFAIVHPPAVRLVASFAVLALAPDAGRAQSSEHAPLAVQLPSSTRALALGDAYVAVRDVDALLYNPALLAGARSGVAASAQLYGKSATLVSATSTVGFGQTFGVGLGVQLLDFVSPGAGIYPVPPGQLTRFVSGKAMSAVIALGAGMVVKGVRVGASAKYLDESLGLTEQRDATVAADLGASKDFGPVTVGLSVQDIGPALELSGREGKLPTRVTAGLAGFGLPVGPLDFGLSSALSVRRDGRVIPAAGAELSWIPIEGIGATGRLGLRYPDPHAGSPVTLGASAFLDRLSVDYAFEGFTGPGSGHRIGIRIR